MRLLFYTEARLIKAIDGNIYNPEGVQNKSTFSRYLDVFESLCIVARVKLDKEYIVKPSEIVNSDNIEVYEIPYYVGFKQYFLKRKKIREKIKTLIEKNKSSAHILRLPGNIGSIAFYYLKGSDYGVEVVGDPYEVFDVSFIKNPIMYLVRMYSFFNLKSITKHAKASIYVTERTLQARYPSQNMYSASNVKILSQDILKYPKTLQDNSKEISIISVGTLEQMYKSPDVLIRAVGLLKSKGYIPKLKWVGEGKYKQEMIELSHSLNLQENIDFVGYVNKRESLISLLDDSDIFVLASVTEGLPRVIIEAFSRGLPVIGTNVGGIPELVDSEMLVNVVDYEMIADKIINLIEDNSLYTDISFINLKKAQNYEESKLQRNRVNFYKDLL